MWTKVRGKLVQSGQVNAPYSGTYLYTDGVAVCAGVAVMRELSAAARAQWLADLVSALDAAKAAVESLPTPENWGLERFERVELLARIESARADARAIQLGRWPHAGGQSPREWIGFPDGSPSGEAGQTPSGKSPPPENGSR